MTLILTDLPEEFSTITLTLDCRLSLAEAGQAAQAAGCLGYALARMNGESLGEPESVTFGDETVLEFLFDSTKCHRSSYSFEEALTQAAWYIMDGTPIRSTNRAGPGTMGTRLIDGLGDVPVSIALDGVTVLDTGAPIPTGIMRRVNVDGTVDTLTLPAAGDARAQALSAALGGAWMDRYPEAYHGLTGHEVWHLDSWHGEPLNRTAQRMIGTPYELRGPVLIVPVAAPNHAERAHQSDFFDRVFGAIAGLEQHPLGTVIVMAGPDVA